MGHGNPGRCMVLKASQRCVSARWGRLRQQRKGVAVYGAVRQGLLRNGSSGKAGSAAECSGWAWRGVTRYGSNGSVWCSGPRPVMYWQQWLGSVQFGAHSCGLAGLRRLRIGSTGQERDLSDD